MELHRRQQTSTNRTNRNAKHLCMNEKEDQTHHLHAPTSSGWNLPCISGRLFCDDTNRFVATTNISAAKIAAAIWIIERCRLCGEDILKIPKENWRGQTGAIVDFLHYRKRAPQRENVLPGANHGCAYENDPEQSCWHRMLFV